jgi:REP element-mobilizing transposase RayT
VTSRGNERRRIYFSKADFEKFKSYLKEAQEKYGCVLHCYVLMNNHYHLLIETPNANISKVMHYVNGSYTNYVNRKRDRSGHLFQGRYKAIVIERDSYLLELSRYLHLNPVRAKMVRRPEEYPYSSYESYITRKEEQFVYRDLIWEMISSDRRYAPRSYREFVEKAIDDDLENPLKNVYAGVILGGSRFIKDVLGSLKEEIFQREEVSHRRELQVAWSADEVIAAVASHFKVSRNEVLQENKEYRSIALYLIKRCTDMTNRRIGEIFGAMSASGVAKANQRFGKKLERDNSLRKRVEKIRIILSHVKG